MPASLNRGCRDSCFAAHKDVYDATLANKAAARQSDSEKLPQLVKRSPPQAELAWREIDLQQLEIG